MKKLVVTLVALAMAIVASAASTDWKFTAANLKVAGGAAFTGTFEVFASGGDLSAPVSVYSNSGKGSYANVTFSSETLVAGNTYDFYFVMTDGGNSLTSAVKSVPAAATGTGTIGWGNQATYTSNADNWKSGGGDVPEPTSGLLLLIGGAMLALRRKQK